MMYWSPLKCFKVETLQYIFFSSFCDYKVNSIKSILNDNQQNIICLKNK